MRFNSIFLIVLLAISIATQSANANPFMGGQPVEAQSRLMGAFSSPFTQKVMAAQKEIHQALTDQITALKDGETLAPLWMLLLISFAYGVFHVLAPGHGKVIVGSYFLGNKAHWKEGLWAGAIMAAGHTATSIGIVTVLYVVLGLGKFQTLSNSTYIELFGYGLIVLIGFWLLFQALSKAPASCSSCGHDHGDHHDHHHHAHKHPHKGLKAEALRLFGAASLIPCTGSMIILLFTLSNDILWAGILAVICVALGMWVTVSCIGFATILMHRMILGDNDTPSGNRYKLLILMRYGAIFLIIATGTILFAGAYAGME